MGEIPLGTPTFLFTDIEGSTTLWQQHNDAMDTAISLHDALLKEVITDEGGYVFKTVGDAICASFDKASDALNAAIKGQRRLSSTDWQDIDVLKVRMALHTGAVQTHNGDYFGLPLSRVARILSAGHGEQLLMSQTTYDLVRDEIPAGISVSDLGEHRLKDLIRPERIFEVSWSDKRIEHAALRTLDNRPNNLPAQMTALVGREHEISQVCDLIKQDDIRIVTLTGPGGTGKTRLGLQVAADCIDFFESGVYFVELAPIDDPQLVLSTIAQTLGLQESGGASILHTVKSYLHDKRLLLMLDNYEQVIEAASLVIDLVSSCAGLKILVTSRERLRATGENEYAVPPLTTPPDLHNSHVVQDLITEVTQFEAVRLFVERAVAGKPQFAVTNENAPAIAEICHRLDGLPLAIELVVARIRYLTPEAILSRLDQRLPMLRKGARDAPERQRTLEGAITWSYELLDESEKRLFAWLGVFSGGFSLEAAETVCESIECTTNADSVSSEEPVDVFEGIGSLVEKSLLKEHDIGDEPRFIMLETIREYAVNCLQRSDDLEQSKFSHAQYFMNLALHAEGALRGSEQTELLKELRRDLDNFRAVISWRTTEKAREIAARTAAALWWFFFRAGIFEEGRNLLVSLTKDDDHLSAVTRSKLRYGAIFLSAVTGDFAPSDVAADEAIKLAKESQDLQNQTWAYWAALAVPAMLDGKIDIILEAANDMIRTCRGSADSVCIAEILRLVGWAYGYSGQLETCEPYFDECITIFDRVGDVRGAFAARVNYAMCLVREGEYLRSLPLLQAGLKEAAASRELWTSAWCLDEIATVQVNHFRNMHRGVVLLGAAAVLFDMIQTGITPLDHARHDETINTARSNLSEEDFDSAWAEGRAMTLDDAVAYVLQESSHKDT